MSDHSYGIPASDYFIKLDATLKNQFEHAFGADFSRVRIHLGHYANDIAQSASADAVTIGDDIYFADGKFVPDSEEGIALLAHELQHIVQQNSDRRFVYLEDIQKAEQEAESVAQTIAGLKLHNISQPVLDRSGEAQLNEADLQRNAEEAARDSTPPAQPDSLENFTHRRTSPLYRVYSSSGEQYDLSPFQYIQGKEEIKRLFHEHLQEMKESKSNAEYAIYMEKVLRYLHQI